MKKRKKKEEKNERSLPNLVSRGTIYKEEVTANRAQEASHGEADCLCAYGNPTKVSLPPFSFMAPPPLLLAYGVDNPRLSLSASQGRPEIMRLFTVLKNDNNLFAILTPHCHSLFELCV